MNKKKILQKFQTIPSIGPAGAEDLYDLGIRSIEDLKKTTGEKLYEKMCKDFSHKVNKCHLYVFRCVVYYATHTNHEPKKLKWWYWKDQK